MGNSSSREARNSQDRGSGSQSQTQSPTSPAFSFSLNPPSNDRTGNGGVYSSRGGRGSRGDLSLFSMGGSGEVDPNGQRRETKQEREARKAEKERVLRARERERSMREEGVDGGYLVTLGTYVGPEDFSKTTVRQLQIERRLAPFWRGLNDHSDSWTEHQLVAAARGQPIPPPDQIPPQDESPSPTEDRNPKANQSNPISNPVPSNNQLQRGPSDASLPQLSPSNSALSTSPSGATPSPLFRGRTKPLASLSSGTNASQPDIHRNEIRLPKQPQINGQPLEAYLYKDVGECPICFLYYPPYLNRTRCCDQPICSECFVQIKRPDPHPPEHADPANSPPENQPPAGEEDQLVSEVATCPFCKMPEFGVTYDPPPFRRGLAYTNDFGNAQNSRNNANGPTRRPRGQSMSATHPDVITTDTVRPDWAKKLAEARSQQARRSAAATALHTAAYMMNDRGSGFPGFSRRRRLVLPDGGQGSSSRPEQMNPAHLEQIMAVLESQENARRESRSRGNGNGTDLFPNRGSSRSNRPEDLEELMMMEAIRLSLQAEEDRKKKEEKEEEKERKREEKRRLKEQKKADKAARKNGTSSFNSSRNNSGFFNQGPSEPLPNPVEGKGKGRAQGTSPGAGSRSRGGYQPGGFNPLDEPTSTLNTEPAGQQRQEDAQKHLEQSRANLSSDKLGVPSTIPRSTSFTSTDSSLGDGSRVDSNVSQNSSAQLLPPISTSESSGNGTDSMFNFNSLNEMMDQDRPLQSQESGHEAGGSTGGRSRGASGASQGEPPRYQIGDNSANAAGDAVETKHGGNVVIGHTDEMQH